MIFSDHNLSVVCRGQSCRKLFTFSSSSPEPLGQFQRNLAQSTKHPWLNGFQFCSNEGPQPFTWGDNYKIAKLH